MTSATRTLPVLISILGSAACWESARTPDLATPADSRPAEARALEARASDVTPPKDQLVARCKDEWCAIPKGTFSMGSPTSETCREAWPDNSKETLHLVTLTRAFEIAEKEVTQQQFESAMGYNPAAKKCDDCPVVYATWHDAAAYCNALSTKAGLASCYTCATSGPDAGPQKPTCTVAAAHATIYDCPGYRLPTEAEWEHAYRAGTSSPYYNGAPCAATVGLICAAHAPIDPIGWYCANSGTVKPVGQKLPNGWGLYDMAGNALEWVNDFHQADLGVGTATDPTGPATGTRWVLKGGGAECPSRDLRAAFRYGHPDASMSALITGFRCARTR